MTTRVDEAARLPELTPEMLGKIPGQLANYLKVLDSALHDAIRNASQRDWAIETSLGLVPRRPNAIITAPLTVGTLPTGSKGMRSFVTDANATTFNSVVASGGANNVPVFYDGSNWRIG